MSRSGEVRVVETHQLSSVDLEEVRLLMDQAFDGDFGDDDFAHALGGWHAVVRDAASGAVLAHAAVVERAIDIGERRYRAGYVEAVAVRPSHQRSGLGSRVMNAIGEVLDSQFELGVLSSGEWAFYESLGWERWHGHSFVRQSDGSVVRTQDDDDGVMVRRGRSSGDVDVRAAITCDERTGDSW